MELIVSVTRNDSFTTFFSQETFNLKVDDMLHETLFSDIMSQVQWGITKRVLIVKNY